VATNATATIEGLDNTFTTQAAVPPTVFTGGASNLTLTSATIAGLVNPNGTATTASFEYGTTTQYGSTAPVPDPGSGISPVDVTANLSNLLTGTTYHYRLVATNAGGTTLGTDGTFTTGGAVPTVVTSPATNILDKSATLNGSLNPNFLATTAFFEYGLTTGYGQTVPLPDVAASGSAVSVSSSISGLLPSTTYHFRLVAQNSMGTTFGDDVSFNTIAEITVPQPVDDSLFVTSKAVTINVLANDINPKTGDSTGLIFDGITVQPQSGTVTGQETLTYTPAKKFPTSGDTFTYRVKNENGETAEAQVNVRSFSAMKGDFATTIEEEGPGVSDTGSLTVTLSSSGKCTAKLIWERKSYSVKATVAGRWRNRLS
jgi:hypothetical protein